MAPGSSAGERRALLDAKLTELVLLAKELCPAAAVKASALPYEDEDGQVDVFTPSGLSDAEEDSVEMAVAERAAQIFEETGLYILCAILGPSPAGPGATGWPCGRAVGEAGLGPEARVMGVR